MISSPAAATPRTAARAEEFLTALCRGNPFSHLQVTAIGAQAVDVPSIHDAEFRRLTALAELARDQNQAVGVVVWGESGSGKSNLLRRLGDWSDGDRRVWLVNVLELQASPDRLARAVLAAVVHDLTAAGTVPWHATTLYLDVEGLVRTALPRQKRTLTAAELETVFREQAAGPVREAGATPAVRGAFDLLRRFLVAAMAAKGRRGDGAAAAVAVRRLAGDSLDEDEARLVGLRPADAADPLDAAACYQVLAALTQLARANGKPVVLCFDQINNLPRQQVADVSKVLHELCDRLRNVLLVLSEVQHDLIQLQEAGVIAQATWDRLTAHKVELPRLTVPEGRRILEARLQRFLQPYEDVPAVSNHFKKDTLFPLGADWFADLFGGRTDVRPRQLISAASKQWERTQRTLEASGDRRGWLDRWPGNSPVKPPVVTPKPPLDEVIDAGVEKAVADRMTRHRAAPQTLPPNADNVCGLVERLLDAGGVGLAVERAHKLSPYDLLVRRADPGGAEVVTGLLFLDTGNANAVTNALGRVVADHSRPGRVVLVTDGRRPLAFGKNPDAKGRVHYAALRGSPGFEHVELAFDDYAALETLDVLARQASDLEVDAGGGSRSLTRAEVAASYRRGRRLEAHPLLGRLVGPPVRPVSEPVLTDAEVRQFIGGRLGISIGASTPELARLLINDLPAGRRAGLDPAACRAKVEAAARAMSEAKELGMQPLPDGYFLLPLRRPAAV